MTSPESPISGLRRRGKTAGSDQDGHPCTDSDGFGSFVDASSFPPLDEEAGPSTVRASPPTFDPGLSESLDASTTSTASEGAKEIPRRSNSLVASSEEDEWQTGDLVQEFSPISPRFPSRLTKTTPRRTTSATSHGHEWTDWDSFLASHTSQLPSASQTPAAEGTTHAPANPADDAFFDAFEHAHIQQQQAQRGPSPPIIDLREVERKLHLKRIASQSKKNKPKEDEDFFAAFERSPERALGRGSALHLQPSQLEDIYDARTSPMRLRSESQPGYFEGSGPTKTESVESAHAAAGNPGHSSGMAASPTESTSPGSWTGSLRRTWTSLRGLSGDLVSHLPSASDFIIPAEEAGASASTHDTNPGGGLLIASDQRCTSNASSGGPARRTSNESRRPSLRTASPASSASGSGAPAGPLRARDLFASSASQAAPNPLRRAPTHSASMPIAGAPGFDTSSTRQWNTGHWTLDAKKAKRIIPVTLSDRREETESVCEKWHAGRIQAALPPRLQLGKRWRLLYSLDQHGTSLATLYHRVAQGLDPSKARKVSSGVQEAEGWLRGASSATKAALGVEGLQASRLKHVGGGLSIQDAGLVIAIKDDNDHVFGAYVNERLRPQQHYYGSGECFLWRTAKRSNADPAAPQQTGRASGDGEDDAADEGDDAYPDKTIETFRWTGKNDYMVLSESDFLSVGGGNGKFGLWIDGALEKGVSSRCPAFDNEVLCDERTAGGDGDDVARSGRQEGRFECIGLEVWAVGID
ncbi:oxidation resistance protein 1 [Thecaphora frezii]